MGKNNTIRRFHQNRKGVQTKFLKRKKNEHTKPNLHVPKYLHNHIDGNDSSSIYLTLGPSMQKKNVHFQTKSTNKMKYSQNTPKNK